MATPKEMDRTSGVARRKAPTGSYNDSPFKGSDPISQIAAFAWRLPGAIASGRTLQGRKVTGEEWSGLAAMAALTGSGIYAGTRGVRGSRPASGPNAGRSGARPMTTAERSAAVTRAGRTGVGNIGPSVGPSSWGDNIDSRYSQVYRQARAIVDNRNTRAMAGRPGVRTPDTVLDVTGDQRYSGYTWNNSGVNPFTDEFEVQNLIPAYLKKTLDWKATRAPLRRTASTKKKNTKR